jgi:hypothetical protein
VRSSGRLVGSVGAVAGLAVLLSGCPLEFQKETRTDSPPFTFFDTAPADTSFKDQVTFHWLGTDLDSDVVAYQYQLVQTDQHYYFFGPDSGQVLRSVDPRSDSPDVQWTARVTSSFQAFAGLEDGWYEMRARSIDSEGVPSAPANRRFYVFFDDIPPQVSIVPNPQGTSPACGRIGQRTSWRFFFTAMDSSRSGITPRSSLEYAYQLRAVNASNCNTHLSDPFTDWTRFPDDTNDPVQAGNTPPTLYSDLFDPQCGWSFTVRVRDPAGQVGTATCCIMQTIGCP